MQRRSFLSLMVALLFIIGALPILSMLLQSVVVDGHFSIEAYRPLFASTHAWKLMKNSVVLALWVTAITILAGVPLGVLLERSNLPARNFFSFLFTIPLLIPPYILAVSWFDLLGTQLLGLSGCIWILSSIFLPIPMLLTRLFLKTIPPQLEAAGRLVANPFRVLTGITLPLIFPGIALAALLVFLLAFGSFSVPSFLRYPVFPVESFTQFSAFYNFKAATATTVPMIAVTFVLLLIEARFLRGKINPLRPVHASSAGLSLHLGHWKMSILGGIALLGLIVVLFPVLILLVQAGHPSIYAEALQRAGGSLFRSLLYALFGSALLTIFGFFIGYLIQTKALRLWATADFLTLFLFALPSTVIGIGLIGLWNTPHTNWVYATPLIILLGYLAKYTALTSRITLIQLNQIPPALDEAARLSGASWFRRTFFITLPLARHGLLVSALVAYIFALRDIGITLLVFPPGHDTLPVRIFTLMANGSPQLVAALCLIMIATTLLPLLFIGLFFLKPRSPNEHRPT